MAEHPHASLVRKGYAAFSRGDMDGLRAIMTGDCTHHVPGNHPLSGDHKGVDNVVRHYEQLAQETGGNMRAELLDVFVDGRGHAVSVHRFTAERGGRKLDQKGGIVFRIVGDKVSDLDECVTDIDADNKFWS